MPSRVAHFVFLTSFSMQPIRILFLIVCVALSVACVRQPAPDANDVGQPNFTVSYSVFIAHPSLPEAQQRIWQKGARMRVETTIEGERSIALIDHLAKTLYVYLPESDTALRPDYSVVSRYPTAWESLQTFFDSYTDVAVAGSELIDGQAVTRYTHADPNGDVTFWVRDSLGFPVKSEVVTSQGMARTLWQDLDFNDLPDELFSLPTGTRIVPIVE